MDNRFTWIVRFDVAPEWVADGFVMTDETALDMLSDKLSHADMDTELAARVISAPSALAIAREQGYDKKHTQSGAVIREIMKGAPLAYSSAIMPEPLGVTLDAALIDAIGLLDSVAFVKAEGDTIQTLERLRAALALVRGNDALPDESIVGDESHHSHINGGDL
jgi:hypothetical protein